MLNNVDVKSSWFYNTSECIYSFILPFNLSNYLRLNMIWLAKQWKYNQPSQMSSLSKNWIKSIKEWGQRGSWSSTDNFFSKNVHLQEIIMSTETRKLYDTYMKQNALVLKTDNTYSRLVHSKPWSKVLCWWL